MNATTWIKILQKSGSENRPLTHDPCGSQEPVPLVFPSIQELKQELDGVIDWSEFIDS